MKALVMYGKKAGMVEVRDVPKPIVKEDEILIQVKAAGVCGTDVDFWLGKNSHLLNPPVILGHEFCGVIVEVGDKVKEWKPGDRVVSDNTGYVCGKCRFCLTGKYVLCEKRKGIGYGMDGGFADYVKIPGEILQRFSGCLMRLPENLSFEEGAILEPACNAYRAVFQDISINPGEAVVIFGPGPIGLFCLQMAKIGGASKVIIIGTQGDETRLSLAQKLGATTINAAKEKVIERVIEVNNGEKVDIVIDAAGPPIVMKQALEIIRKEGHIVKIGWSADPLNISLDPLIANAITLKGHWGYDYISWKNVLNLVRENKIDFNSIITNILPLSKWKEAFMKIRDKKSVKIVLKPD